MDLTNNLLFVSLIMASISAAVSLSVYVIRTLSTLKRQVHVLQDRMERRRGERLGKEFRAS